MCKKDFEAFLDRQQEKRTDTSQTIDWEKTKRDWIDSVEELYNQIESYISEYIEQKKIMVDYSKKEISEEYIGTYEIKTMIIVLNDEKIKLDPIGANIIAANGRVDLLGKRGKAKFIYVPKDSKRWSIKITERANSEEPKIENPEKSENKDIVYKWKIAPVPPEREYIELNQNMFLTILMEITGE